MAHNLRHSSRLKKKEDEKHLNDKFDLGSIF